MWTSSVEQISIPLWENLMELNGDTPLNKEDNFIGERGVTFVGYKMFGGEKLSFERDSTHGVHR